MTCSLWRSNPLSIFPSRSLDCLKMMETGKVMDIVGTRRSFAAKCWAVSVKLLVKMFLTVANIPMKEEHGKNSLLFTELKTRTAKLHKEVVAMRRPFRKVLPKGDGRLSILDKIETKMSVDALNKEHKAFTDALFDFIDVDKDGKIPPAEYAVYTDLSFKMSVDDEGAKAFYKAKLMAILSSVDLDKSGFLSKGELSSFMINLVDITIAYTLLLLAYIWETSRCACVCLCVHACVRVRVRTHRTCAYGFCVRV